MKKLICALAIALATPAAAQQAPAIATIPVPFNAQERALVLELCAEGLWAARHRFDGMCEYLRNKFDVAEKAAKPEVPAAEAPQPTAPKESEHE